MFKFKINANNEHHFKSNVVNEHRFKSSVINEHFFKLKSLTATIFEKLGFGNTYRSDIRLGGKRVTLIETLFGVRLRDMFGLKIEEISGGFLHLLAKIKPQIVYPMKTLSKMKSLIKARFNNVEHHIGVIGGLLKGKLRLSNFDNFTIRIINILRTKDKFSNTTRSTSTIGSIPLAILQSTPLRDLPKKLREFAGHSYVVAKAKFRSRFISSGTVSVKSKIKARVENVTNGIGRIGFKIILKVWLNENISRGEVNIKSFLTTKNYGEVLYSVTQSIGGYYADANQNGVVIYSLVRVLSKVRTQNNVKLGVIAKNKIKAKIKTQGVFIKHLSQEIKTRAFRCIKIDNFKDKTLQQVPSTLFDFCYTE